MRDVYHGEDNPVAVEVVARTWVSFAVDPEQIAVQRCGHVEIGHLDSHTEKLRNSAHTMLLLLTDRGPGERQVGSLVGGASIASHPPTTRWRWSSSRR